MLREEAKLARDHLVEEAAAVGGPEDVGRLCRRQEDDLPPSGAQPPAPVGLLAEEEKVLVRRAHLLDRRAPEQEASTHDPLRLALRGVVEVAGIERVEGARARRELAQEEELRRQPPERREAP